MEVDELSLIGPFDLANVDAIHRKRLLAFVNHFIIQTTHFLNKLARSCEGKLLQTELRLQKLEAALILLESKLESIPGLSSSITGASLAIPTMEVDIEPLKSAPSDEFTEETHETEPPAPVLDESLVRFSKMLHVGVPVPAVKLKMEQEGVPPDKQTLVLNSTK